MKYDHQRSEHSAVTKRWTYTPDVTDTVVKNAHIGKNNSMDMKVIYVDKVLSGSTVT
jgi:hypothetical protein